MAADNSIFTVSKIPTVFLDNSSLGFNHHPLLRIVLLTSWSFRSMDIVNTSVNSTTDLV